MYRTKIAATALVCLFSIFHVFASEPETGEASWYGPGFHGRRTANGEIFDKEELTAAHRSLPFGTLLRVRNLDNGKEVVVRINDRGPFARGRILDLSEAAARRLGMIESGTARVRLLIVSPGSAADARAATVSKSAAVPSPGTTAVRIQVASYRDAANAARAVERLRLSGLAPTLETEGGYTRVVLTGVSVAEKDALVRRLAELGYPGVLVRVETRL